MNKILDITVGFNLLFISNPEQTFSCFSKTYKIFFSLTQRGVVNNYHQTFCFYSFSISNLMLNKPCTFEWLSFDNGHKLVFFFELAELFKLATLLPDSPRKRVSAVGTNGSLAYFFFFFFDSAVGSHVLYGAAFPDSEQIFI